MVDTGKIALGLGVFAAIASAPVWIRVGRGRGEPPELERPKDARECIEPVSTMRARHMEILDSWRNAVVRRAEHVYVASNGRRHDMSLTGTCLSCHVDPGKFCTRCHEYAGVEVGCWDCHHPRARERP